MSLVRAGSCILCLYDYCDDLSYDVVPTKIDKEIGVFIIITIIIIIIIKF